MRRGEFATMLVGAYELNFFARHKEDVNSQMRTFVSFAAYTKGSFHTGWQIIKYLHFMGNFITIHLVFDSLLQRPSMIS